MSTPNNVRGVTFGEGDADVAAPGALGGVNQTTPGAVSLEGTAETFVRTNSIFWPWTDATLPENIGTSPDQGVVNKVARRDHRHDLEDDTQRQLVEVSLNGTLKGTRSRINFINGGGVVVDAFDDPTDNEIEVTITV